MMERENLQCRGEGVSGARFTLDNPQREPHSGKAAKEDFTVEKGMWEIEKGRSSREWGGLV